MSNIKYDFDKKVVREGTSCLKYDRRDVIFNNADVLPMWVADMDFETPDFVRFAMIERAMHPIFGYTFRDDSYYEAMIGWLQRRHNWKVEQDWILYTPGVVPALHLAVNALTEKGDKIILQPPVYFPFFSVVKNHERTLVENPLLNSNGAYRIDFDLLEKQAKDAKMLILCNPHNPVGRSWTVEELNKIANICLENNIIVVSDEIHNDLVLPPHRHQVFANLSEEVANITLTAHAASKTFNLAGLSSASMIISNPELRERYQEALTALHLQVGNVFGFEAFKAAFQQGDAWLDQLISYVQNNIDYAVDYLNQKLPKIKVRKPEATYLLWLDFSEYGLSEEELSKLLVDKAGLGLNKGRMYGQGGENHMRMNMACPLDTVKVAVERLYSIFKDL